MSHFKQFTLVHSMYSKRSIVIGEHYQLPLEWGKEKKVDDSSLKHRFQYLLCLTPSQALQSVWQSTREETSQKIHGTVP